MRRRNALLSVCLVGPLLANCKVRPQPAAPANPSECGGFTWLAGVWETANDGTQNVERWVPEKNGTVRGESITRSGDQVVHTESLRIARGPSGLEYQASPQDQPANVFPLDACGSTWARFTDPTHDWPQSIHYARTNDTLTATVSGTTDGKERTQTWSWTLAAPEPAGGGSAG